MNPPINPPNKFTTVVRYHYHFEFKWKWKKLKFEIEGEK